MEEKKNEHAVANGNNAGNNQGGRRRRNRNRHRGGNSGNGNSNAQAQNAQAQEKPNKPQQKQPKNEQGKQNQQNNQQGGKQKHKNKLSCFRKKCFWCVDTSIFRDLIYVKHILCNCFIFTFNINIIKLIIII